MLANHYRTLALVVALLGLQTASSLGRRDCFGQAPGTPAVDSPPTSNYPDVVEDLRKGALISVGKATMPYIQLTVFVDFQCPYCRDLDKSLRILEAGAERDSLRIIFRSFPKPKHAWAMPAAIAAVCGAEQNQRYYFELSDYFYAHQADLTESTVYPAARELLGKDNVFDVAHFDNCIENGPGKKIVDADIALGVRAGVMFTPTLFINDKLVVGSRGLAGLHTLLLRANPLQH